DRFGKLARSAASGGVGSFRCHQSVTAPSAGLLSLRPRRSPLVTRHCLTFATRPRLRGQSLRAGPATSPTDQTAGSASTPGRSGTLHPLGHPATPLLTS